MVGRFLGCVPSDNVEPSSFGDYLQHGGKDFVPGAVADNIYILGLPQKPLGLKFCDQLDTRDEPFGLISFNYDTFLDQAVQRVSGLIKPHGSINWIIPRRPGDRELEPKTIRLRAAPARGNDRAGRACLSSERRGALRSDIIPRFSILPRGPCRKGDC